MTVQFLIEKTPEILQDFPEIRLVYLFGSRVNGEIGPMSDYDFGIVEDSDDRYSIQVKFQHVMQQRLQPAKVDVVLLLKAPVELAYHVIANGILLFKKDEYTYVEFEARILSLYGDYLPILREYQNEILRGGEYEKRVQRYREALGRTQRTLSKTRSSSTKRTP
jgi:uncharacterized protein